MHTFIDHRTQTAFNYNADFSGDVLISREGGAFVAVPFSALRTFVAHYVKLRRIEDLEGAHPDRVLGVVGR
jgi:hypothetical protein